MTAEPENGRKVFDRIHFPQQSDVLNIVLDHITQGMVVVGPDYRTLAFNHFFEEIFQLPTGTVEVGVDFRDILKIWAQETGQDQHMLDLAIVQLDEPAPFEFEFSQLIHGETRWCLLTHNPLPGRGFVRTFTDITERKQSEMTLRQEQLFSKSLLESLPGIFYLYTYPELRLIRWNKSHELLLGYDAEEMEGRHVTDWHVPEAKETVIAAIETVMEKGQNAIEASLLTKDGSKIPFLLTGVGIESQGKRYLMGIGIDITERLRAEEERIGMEKQLLHAQKLESLGVLAGGIAHDFNNILLAIIGNADLALMRINKESPVIDNLHKIEQAAARAADLAKQMLAYSGKGKFVLENINLNILLEEMLHMLEVSISKKAALRLNTTRNLPSVEADATQIRQIIMNLVINASEAIGDKSGDIEITTGYMDCDRSYLNNVWLDENLADGPYVYLEIADSGCGMDKETLSKLFDPFFTTKFTGRGLGMAAVLGIVRGHKGSIKVYSELGKGTTFKILLPASGRPAEIFNVESHQDDWKGSGKVLLVDDEETVREIGAEMLKELGFTPITAVDGMDALEIFKSTPDIDLVILDLTMPRMDGEQCFRELRQLRSEVKVVMSSGFSEHEVTQKFVGKGLAGFIQKPYKLSVLKDAIRDIMNQLMKAPESASLGSAQPR